MADLSPQDRAAIVLLLRENGFERNSLPMDIPKGLRATVITALERARETCAAKVMVAAGHANPQKAREWYSDQIRSLTIAQLLEDRWMSGRRG